MDTTDNKNPDTKASCCSELKTAMKDAVKLCKEWYSDGYARECIKEAEKECKGLANYCECPLDYTVVPNHEL